MKARAQNLYALTCITVKQKKPYKALKNMKARAQNLYALTCLYS